MQLERKCAMCILAEEPQHVFWKKADLFCDHMNFCCWFIKKTNILKLQKKLHKLDCLVIAWNFRGANKAWALTTGGNKSLETKRGWARGWLDKPRSPGKAPCPELPNCPLPHSFNRSRSLAWCKSVTRSLVGGCKVWWGWWYGSYGKQAFAPVRKHAGLVNQVELADLWFRALWPLDCLFLVGLSFNSFQAGPVIHLKLAVVWLRLCCESWFAFQVESPGWQEGIPVLLGNGHMSAPYSGLKNTQIGSW